MTADSQKMKPAFFGKLIGRLSSRNHFPNVLFRLAPWVGDKTSEVASAFVNGTGGWSPLADILLIAIVWCASIALVNPFGDFPMNDDWSFAASVKHLIEHGYYDPTDWTSMTLVSHVAWGWLFCLPF